MASGGGRAIEDAGAGVEIQAGGQGRGQRIHDAVFAAGGYRQGQVNRRVDYVVLVAEGRAAEGWGGVRRGRRVHRDLMVSVASSVPAALPSVSPAV